MIEEAYLPAFQVEAEVHESCAPFEVVSAWAHVADHVEEVFTWASVPADLIMVSPEKLSASS